MLGALQIQEVDGPARIMATDQMLVLMENAL